MSNVTVKRVPPLVCPIHRIDVRADGNDENGGDRATMLDGAGGYIHLGCHDEDGSTIIGLTPDTAIEFFEAGLELARQLKAGIRA